MRTLSTDENIEMEKLPKEEGEDEEEEKAPNLENCDFRNDDFGHASKE